MQSAQTLYLHIGPAKTGTSAIQHYLSRTNIPRVLYPVTGQWPDGSHHNLVLNFLENFSRPEVIRRDPGKMLDEIGGEVRRSNRDVLISSETLAGARNVGEFIEACKKHWRIDGLQIKILIVCREHFERASSLYNQRVKDATTLERESADAFLSERADRLRYAPIIRRLEQTGYEVVALNYHPAETFLARFLMTIGVHGDAPEIARHNISLSISGLVVHLALNRISQTAEEREFLRAKLGDIPGLFSPSEFIFGLDAALAAKKIFAKDRKMLSEKFGIVFEPPRIKQARNSLYLNDQTWSDITNLAHRLGDKSAVFLEEITKFRRAND